MVPVKSCLEPECHTTSGEFVRGYCRPHYLARLRSGALVPLTRTDRLLRLVDKSGPIPDPIQDPLITAPPTACWLWLGAKLKYGYGRAKLNGASTTAHRAVYSMLVGMVPKGLDVDHLCRNPSCVNPDHLEPVTRSQNVRRGLGGVADRPGVRKAACVKGHPFTPENTRVGPSGRKCIACHREFNRQWMRDYRARKSA